MGLNIWAGMLGGFVGTIAMMLLMRLSIAMGMTDMPPMPLIQGAMVSDDPGTAKRIGMATHVLVMGTLVFGIIYAAVFSFLGTAGWLSGAIVGLVHGLIAGLAMKMMGQSHPRMEPVANFTGGETWRHDGGRLRLAKPGLFAKNYGAMTPVGLLMAHAVFGLVLGAIYAGIV